MKFSDRLDLARSAIAWCERHDIPITAHNTITFLDEMKMLRDPVKQITWDAFQINPWRYIWEDINARRPNNYDKKRME